MKVSKIKNLKTKVKTLEVFANNNCSYEYLAEGENLLIKNTPSNIEKIYMFPGRNLYYTTDKKLYITDSYDIENYYEITPPIRLNSAPAISITFTYYGYTAYLVSNGSSSFEIYYDGGTGASIRYGGKKLLWFQGRMIYMSEEYIYISAPFNHETFFTEHSRCNYVGEYYKLYGKMVGIFEINSELYLFFEHKICKMTIRDTLQNSSILEMNVFSSNIQENSLSQIADKVYYLDSGKLCVFDGNGVTVQKSLISKKMAEAKATCAYNGIYFVEIDNQIYYKDTMGEQEGFIMSHGLLCETYPFLRDNHQDGLKEFHRKQSTEGLTSNYLMENEFDFGSNKRKCLMSIYYDGVYSIGLEIHGDNGQEKELTLRGGEGEVEVNMVSTKFKIVQSWKTVYSNVKKLRLTYKEIE